MDFLTKILVALVALIHVWFLMLEMYFWKKPLGRKIFHLQPEFAEQSAALAANQGLYNGFLAVGLIWSLIAEKHLAYNLQYFFLSCIIVAGCYGAYSVNKRIFLVQALPALIALSAVIMSAAWIIKDIR